MNRMNSQLEKLTLVHLLAQRAEEYSDFEAHAFLTNQGERTVGLSYRELDQKARKIALTIKEMNAVGERILLLYSPGLEFISAFFGCLYAGAIAIPAYPPRKNRADIRLQAIVRDSDAKMILSDIPDDPEMEHRFEFMKELKHLKWLNTTELKLDADNHWQIPNISSDSLAFLQYTSGSTSDPKGVMVSHRNLVENLKLIHNATNINPEKRGVSWLPFYHDMGLVTGVLQPIFDNFPMLFLSPLDILQNPLIWLESISQFKATHSGGPNFAYELCVNRIKPDDCNNLDLSSWEVAFNGAEPIRVETLNRFAVKFGPFGFYRNAFLPCYGLAEATVGVSWGTYNSYPKYCTVDKKMLASNKIVDENPNSLDAQVLVGCGKPPLEYKLVIVDPVSLLECSSDEIGEVWISGSSVTLGYWNRFEETNYSFNAYLADTNDGPFLRTGDLGFKKDGELFITGRLKDLIIIRGQNFYPQDIEYTIEKSHRAVASGSGAVFSVEIESEERIVIVTELKRQFRSDNVEEIIRCIYKDVSLAHGISIYAICLINPLSIPKTSSGKIQRNRCRDEFLSGSLKTVAIWQANKSEVTKDQPSPYSINNEKKMFGEITAPSSNEIKLWILQWMSTKMNLPLNNFSSSKTFVENGLDSAKVVELVLALEVWLHRSISPTILWNLPTIDALVDYLSISPEQNSGLLESNFPPEITNKTIDQMPSSEDFKNLSDAELSELLSIEIAKAKEQGKK